MIKVPSLSKTFCMVLARYFPASSSMTGYLSGIQLSSATRPFGQAPPHGNPSARAASRAPRSMPVCAPEMILDRGMAELRLMRDPFKLEGTALLHRAELGDNCEVTWRCRYSFQKSRSNSGVKTSVITSAVRKRTVLPENST